MGNPGYVTFERLNSEVSITADSAVASYGSKVTFTLQAEPAVVEGQPMVIYVDSVAWLTDPDSLGGDYTDAKQVNACTFYPVGGVLSTKACELTVRSAGTLKVIGSISGKRYEKEQHVGRRDAYPIVTPTKFFVTAGQRDTFTVRMSDGSSFGMYAWGWAADSGTAQTTKCQNWEHPCRNAIIRESGWMQAWVTHDGKVKKTRVHITVGPRPRLMVNPTTAQPLLGTSLQFTTSAGNAPYSITGWKFHRAPLAQCGTEKQCAFTPPHSGRLWVYGLVDNSPDSASADITVTLNADDKGLNNTVPDSAAVSVLTVDTEGGVTTTPGVGKYVYPKDTTISYVVTSLSGFAEPAVVAGDTLAPTPSVLAMTRSWTLSSGAEWNWAADPEVAALRSRLRQLVSTATAARFAQHIVWYMDSTAFTVQSPDSVDLKLAAAEWLEFGVYTDRSALSAYDEALSGYAFRLLRNSSGDHSVRIISPSEYPPLILAMRVPAPPAALDVVDTTGPKTAIIYVNGIRVTETDVTGNGVTGDIGTLRRLEGLVLTDTALKNGAWPTYFYNKNMTAQLAAFDHWSGCGGVGTRALSFGGVVTSLARFVPCNLGRGLVAVTMNDFVQSATAFADIIFGSDVAKFVVPDVAELAARLYKFHSDSGYNTIYVTHSQGNMVAQQAYTRLGQAGLIQRCLAHVSLASPIGPGAFWALPEGRLNGFTIFDDPLYGLQQLTGSTFTQVSSQEWVRATDEIAQASWWRKPFKVLGRPNRVHGANKNYFDDTENGVTLRGLMRSEYDSCSASP